MPLIRPGVLISEFNQQPPRLPCRRAPPGYNSMDWFGTVAFDRALMDQNIVIDRMNASLELGRWMAVVPAAYRVRVEELVHDVFASWHKMLLNETTRANFVCALHDKAWTHLLPLMMYDHDGLANMEAVTKAIVAIYDVREYEVSDSASEPGVLRVFVHEVADDLDPRDEHVLKMVSAVVRTVTAAGVEVRVHGCRGWDLGKLKLPIEALDVEQLEEMSVDLDDKLQAGNDVSRWERWATDLAVERRRRELV